MGFIGKVETKQPILLDEIDQAAAILKLSDNSLKALLNADKCINVTFVVELQRGEREFFQGIRVLHNNILGPYIGPMYFEPDLTEATAKKKALELSLSASLCNTPIGGAWGGIQLNPNDYTLKELEKIQQTYIKTIEKHLACEHDLYWFENSINVESDNSTDWTNTVSSKVAREIFLKQWNHNGDGNSISPLLLNGGQALAAYQIWLKEKMGIFNSVSDIKQKITERLNKTTNEVLFESENSGIKPSTTAVVLALKNLSRVLSQKGLWP